MRRGEVFGLRWQDVDLLLRRLTINQVTEQTAAGVRYKEPKTEASRRSVTLPPLTVEALTAHKAQQAREFLQLGLGTPELVFSREDGNAVRPDRFSNVFISQIRRSGLRPVSFHNFRHTHATLLLSAGVPPNVVAERLGHSSTKMTLDRYGHVLQGQQENVARQVDTTLRAVLDG